MADVFVFADESGNFDFSSNKGASRFFTICTVTASDTSFGDVLLNLRREMAWRDVHLDRGFHASTDPQAVRDEVFDVLRETGVRIDATLLEKTKAIPKYQSETELYKIGWYLHFKYVAPLICEPTDRLLVAAAELGTKKRKAIFRSAVEDVVTQVAPCDDHRVAFWRDESDPCLWAADYMTWAVQRKFERGDPRSYDLIEHMVASAFQPWEGGITNHY